MSRFKRNWDLMRCSLTVINKNKRLLLFPLLSLFMVSTFALLFMATSFMATSLLWPTGHSYGDSRHWESVFSRFLTESRGASVVAEAPGAGETASVVEPAARDHYAFRLKPAGFAWFAALYFTSMFLASFLNAVFFHEIINALNGNGVSVRRGLRFATTRIRAILMWSLLAGLVGYIIKMLEDRLSFVGRWVLRVVGLTWSVSAVFAIPVIVREKENANPFGVLKRSARLLTRTWGEGLIGYLGLHVAGLTAVVVVSIVMVAGAVGFAVVTENYWLAGGAGVLWLLVMLACGLLGDVAAKVYVGALYVYAVEGAVPEPFDEEMMERAWKLKAGRKPGISATPFSLE